jgi:hypothetical protein
MIDKTTNPDVFSGVSFLIDEKEIPYGKVESFHRDFF